MKTEIFVFEKNQITFTLDKDNKVMVNATEMAKVFNKETEPFMRNESTKSFILSCLKTENSRFLNLKCEEDLYTSKQKTGTFMHRVLALKFAAWLNPDFEVWVYLTIDKLLFGKYVEREKSLEKTVVLQKEAAVLAAKPTKTGEDFERYLQIEAELRREQAVRKNLTKESVCEMQDMFEEED